MAACSALIERLCLVTFASLIVVLLFFLNHTPYSTNVSVLQNLPTPLPTSNHDQLNTIMPRAIMQESTNGNELPSATSPPRFPISNSQSCFPFNFTDWMEAAKRYQLPMSAIDLHDSKPSSNADNIEEEKPSRQVIVPVSSDVQDSKPPDAADNLEPAEILTPANGQPAAASNKQVPMPESGLQNPSMVSNDDEERIEMEKVRKCNVFEGRWVYDPKESPLYDGSMCNHFFSNTASCRENGRADREYEKWRWEAKDCKIPRFNAKDMLERLRGKRLIFVGDSINFSQWESLACLLYSHMPDQVTVDGHGRFFRSDLYDCSVEFHWSKFLIELQENKTSGKKSLKLDSVSPNARKWIGADIMVFNTGHWWLSRQRWDFFQYKGKVFDDMKTKTAFRMAMKTWVQWIERNVDFSKTKLFFRGMSPVHSGKHRCYQATQPIMDESYKLSSLGNSLKDIVERIISGMRKPVKYLNITKLTGYRTDAHSSIYTNPDAKFLIARKQRRPALPVDCSHWCLPGVPDTWNELLYASMVLDTTETTAS